MICCKSMCVQWDTSAWAVYTQGLSSTVWQCHPFTNIYSMNKTNCLLPLWGALLWRLQVWAAALFPMRIWEELPLCILLDTEIRWAETGE